MADGGGVNHRAGLYDAILIKENHSAAAGGVGEAVRRARAHRPDLPIAVEVRDAAEIDEALAAGAPRLLLDNMTPDEIRAAVAQVGGRAELEASGGVERGHSFGLCDHRGATLRVDGRAHPFSARARSLTGPGGPPLEMTLLTLDNIPAPAVRGTRAGRRARRRDPRPQLPAARGPGRGRLRRRLARPLPAGGPHRRRGDRVLRRALHGRDGVDPLAREDRPAARSRRRLLAGRLDHRRPAARLEGAAPGRGGRHVRQHDGRREGRDRLLRDVLERRAGRRAHLPRARRGHRDPVRAGHVPRRVRREVDRPQDARVGRRVPRARRDPAVGHPRRCAPRTRAPTSSSTPSAAARPR